MHSTPISGLMDPFHHPAQLPQPAAPPRIGMPGTDQSHLLREVGQVIAGTWQHASDPHTHLIASGNENQANYNRALDAVNDNYLGLPHGYAPNSLMTTGIPQEVPLTTWHSFNVWSSGAGNLQSGNLQSGLSISPSAVTKASSFTSGNTALTTISVASSGRSNPLKREWQTHLNDSQSVEVDNVVQQSTHHQSPIEEDEMERQKVMDRLRKLVGCEPGSTERCAPCRWYKKKVRSLDILKFILTCTQCIPIKDSPLCVRCMRHFSYRARSWRHCLLDRYSIRITDLKLYRERTDDNLGRPYKTLARKPFYQDIIEPLVQGLTALNAPIDILLTRADKGYPSQRELLKLTVVQFQQMPDSGSTGIDSLRRHRYFLLETDPKETSRNVATYVRRATQKRMHAALPR